MARRSGWAGRPAPATRRGSTAWVASAAVLAALAATVGVGGVAASSAGAAATAGRPAHTVSVTCAGLGTFKVALPSGVPTTSLPTGMAVMVGFRATDLRTGSSVTGGEGTGEVTCATVPFSHLNASDVVAGAVPAGVAPGDGLTGSWQISVRLDVTTGRPAGLSPAIVEAPAQTPAGFVGALQSYISTRAGTASVAVFDATDGVTYTVAPQDSFVTASIVKVDILGTLLRDAQVAGRSLTAQENSLATQMIEVSDNDAATALWNEVGGAPGVAGFDRLVGGMPNTVPGAAGQWGLTQTTAPDQVQLVRDVAYSNSVLGPGQRAYMQGLMENVTPSQRWGVSGGVPSGVTVALKNGWLPVGNGWEINSIGHVVGKGKDYVIAVLTAGSPSMSYGITTIQGVSSVAWSQMPSNVNDGPGPSIAVASKAIRYVFYKGANGDLFQEVWNVSAWAGPDDLGMGPLGSEPTADVDANGLTSVFWKGADANLWEAYRTGATWSGPHLIGMGPLGSPPSVTVSAKGEQYVFWEGSDGNLWQTLGTNGAAFAGPYLVGMGPLGSTPSADIDDDGNPSVFWKGSDGNLWDAYWTGTSWAGPRYLGMGTLGSPPSVTVADDGTQYAFWQGGDGNLWQAIGNNSGALAGAAFAGPYNIGMGPLGSTPSVGIDGTGATYAVWKGTDGNLWQGYWAGTGWAGPLGVGVALGGP